MRHPVEMKMLLGSVALLFLSCGGVVAGEAPEPAQGTFDSIVKAMTTDDYELFVAQGDDEFKALPRENFASVTAQLAPRFEAGYGTTYLGALRQRGYEVTLWRFRFKDGGDDLLGTLSMKDGRVGGFWIK